MNFILSELSREFIRVQKNKDELKASLIIQKSDTKLKAFYKAKGKMAGLQFASTLINKTMKNGF